MNKIYAQIEQIKNNSKEIKKVNFCEQYELKSVPEELQNCENIESLNISYTSIQYIPDYIFQLPKLKEISYSGCDKLASQPTGIKYAKNLESISVYLPVRQKLPKDIYSLNKIKSLTIQGEIEELEDEIYKCKTLEDLILFGTKIKDLPESINKLSQLKNISFWQPLFLPTTIVVPLELNSIFKKLSKCDSLKSLQLEKNGITKIPESIKLLKSLQKFSAKDNKITSIPIELYELIKLKELDLGENQIAEIPKGIEKLLNLKSIKLNSNWKYHLNTDNLFADIDKLTNLEVLELWSCESKITIPDKICNLKKLKVLDLSGNNINALPQTIDQLKQIKKCRLM